MKYILSLSLFVGFSLLGQPTNGLNGGTYGQFVGQFIYVTNVYGTASSSSTTIIYTINGNILSNYWNTTSSGGVTSLNGDSGSITMHGPGIQTNGGGDFTISGGSGYNPDGSTIILNGSSQLALDYALGSAVSNWTAAVAGTTYAATAPGYAPGEFYFGSDNNLYILTNTAGVLYNWLTNAASYFAATYSTNSTNFTLAQLANANTNQVYLNVLLYGAVADGITDNTTVLKNLFSTNNSSWYFPVGSYLSQELMITNGVSIQMAPGASLVYALNAWNTNIFIREMLNTNITLVNFAIDGQQYPNTSAETNTWFGFDGSWGSHPFTLSEIYHFMYWNPNGLRHGLQVNIDQVGECRNIFVKGFNGCGVLPLSIGGTGDYTYPKLEFTSANIQSNFMGLYCVEPYTLTGYITNWQTNYVPNAQTPEYEHFTQISIQGNVVGMDFYAANSVIDNSHLVNNYIGALENAPFGYNNQHGVISHCFFNHTLSIPLYLQGVTQSELIDGCYFAGNSNAVIGMDDCTGVTFQGCVFENTMYFRVNQQASVANGRNFLLNNKYTGTWSNNIASNMLNDGSLLWQGNYSYDTAPDNDGSPLSQIGATNGPNTVFTNALFVLNNLTASNFWAQGQGNNGGFVGQIASGNVTNQNGSRVAYLTDTITFATNAATTTVACTNGGILVVTTGTTFAGLANLPAVGQEAVFILNVTNSSGSLATLTPVSSWRQLGTWNITNESTLYFDVIQNMHTNVICVPWR